METAKNAIGKIGSILMAIWFLGWAFMWFFHPQASLHLGLVEASIAVAVAICILLMGAL